MGVTNFVSEIKRVQNYPDVEKFAHVIQHGLQGFTVKNRELKHRRFGATDVNRKSKFLFFDAYDSLFVENVKL